MDLWQLHIFCKVVELRSFSRAGHAVHLSQPTVSSHIKDLETHFGCRLVDRLSREVVPTKAGELLFEYARKMIALRDQAESAMAEFQGTVRGHLVVGGSTIPGGYILPRQMGEFSRRHPEVRVTLVIHDTEEVIGNILEGRMEIGVVGARTEDKRLVQEVLVEDRMKLIVRGDHPWAKRDRVDLEMLRTEPFIAREDGSGTRSSILSSLSKKNITFDDFNVVAEMGSTEAVVQGIRGGVGVSILSPIAIVDALRAKSLAALAVEDIDLTRHFYITYHRHRTLSPLARTFHEYLQELSLG